MLTHAHAHTHTDDFKVNVAGNVMLFYVVHYVFSSNTYQLQISIILSRLRLCFYRQSIDQLKLLFLTCIALIFEVHPDTFSELCTKLKHNLKIYK